jgi:hypothetical protein
MKIRDNISQRAQRPQRRRLLCRQSFPRNLIAASTRISYQMTAHNLVRNLLNLVNRGIVFESEAAPYLIRGLATAAEVIALPDSLRERVLELIAEAPQTEEGWLQEDLPIWKAARIDGVSRKARWGRASYRNGVELLRMQLKMDLVVERRINDYVVCLSIPTPEGLQMGDPIAVLPALPGVEDPERKKKLAELFCEFFKADVANLALLNNSQMPQYIFHYTSESTEDLD